MKTWNKDLLTLAGIIGMGIGIAGSFHNTNKGDKEWKEDNAKIDAVLYDQTYDPGQKNIDYSLLLNTRNSKDTKYALRSVYCDLLFFGSGLLAFMKKDNQ
ncbi:MAG: hypothetical protein PHH54_02355 [Candidatus Nanoarchaeia archaeon]|nr:hypothetical protein [Candidatus Nanoarchaeia archaeon]MDD5740804.1 hypothetical protein [Candidatus Nanoarchaeia archaeon]